MRPENWSTQLDGGVGALDGVPGPPLHPATATSVTRTTHRHTWCICLSPLHESIPAIGTSRALARRFRTDKDGFFLAPVSNWQRYGFVTFARLATVS